MEDITPQQKEVHDRLKATIAEFNAVCHGAEGVLTGYVLFTNSMRYDTDGDMIFRDDYSIGIGTDLSRAIGMIRVGQLQLESDVVGVKHHHHPRTEIYEEDDEE